MLSIVKPPYLSDAASDVLKTHQDQFFEAVDAKFNLLELKRKEVIPDGLAIRIETADDKSAREMLFQHLYRNANVATLREYCRIAKSAGAFPKMQDLGEKMLRDLPPEGLLGLVGVLLVRMCVCVCVCRWTSTRPHHPTTTPPGVPRSGSLTGLPLQSLVATVAGRPGAPRRPVLRPWRPAAAHPRVLGVGLASPPI